MQWQEISNFFSNKKYVKTILFFCFLLTVTFIYFQKLIWDVDTIPGFGLDPFFCMFVIDTNSKHLSAGNFLEIANLSFFYPKKHTLGFSDPLIFHSFLFALIKLFVTSKATAIRYMFVLFFLLNWLVCTQFLFHLKKKINISIFVGWLFAFSLFFQVQSAHYQNLLVFPVFLSILPLFSPEMKLKYKFIYSFLGISIFLISNLYL